MAITIQDNGKNNTIQIPEEVRNDEKINIVIHGNDNRINIDSNTTFKDATITVGSYNCVSISSNCNLNKLEIFAKDEAIIKIGKNVGCTWHTRIYAHEKGEIFIGDDCLIADGVLCTISDMHSIIDVNTGKRLNPAKNIYISNHVWLAEAVKVMGGVTIGEHSIIGAGSIVTKNQPSNCVCAGAPARIVKTGVTWRRDLI